MSTNIHTRDNESSPCFADVVINSTTVGHLSFYAGGKLVMEVDAEDNVKFSDTLTPIETVASLLETFRLARALLNRSGAFDPCDLAMSFDLVVRNDFERACGVTVANNSGIEIKKLLDNEPMTPVGETCSVWHCKGPDGKARIYSLVVNDVAASGLPAYEEALREMLNPVNGEQTNQQETSDGSCAGAE